MDENDQTIETAERFYRAGQYGNARRLARQIAKSASSTDEKNRAAHILKATGIDPAAVVAFAVTGGLLLFLIFRYVL